MFAAKALVASALFIVTSGHPDRPSAVLNVGETDYDVLEFGNDVLEYLQNFDSYVETIIKTINSILESPLISELLSTVLPQMNIERIKSASLAIRSSLFDLKYIINEENDPDRDDFIQQFDFRYEQLKIQEHITFTKQLLKYQIPGISGDLVNEFANGSRCSVAEFNSLKRMVAELWSSAYALESAYTQLKFSGKNASQPQDWQNKVDEASDIFGDQEGECMQEYVEYAKEDLNNTEDARTLWRVFQERYPFKAWDVIFLERFGTYQFLYYKYHDESLYLNRVNDTKIVVNSDVDASAPDPDILSYAKAKCRAVINGTRNAEAAKDVGNCVEKHLNSLGLFIRALIVFFDDGQAFRAEDIFIDDESPVLRLTIENVAQKYCYTLSCMFSSEHTVGDMKVFAYVGASKESNSKYREGAAVRTRVLTPLVYLLIFLFTHMLLNYDI